MRALARSERTPLRLEPQLAALRGPVAQSAPEPCGRLLLVEETALARARLQRGLTARGFEVTAVAGLREALSASGAADFSFAVLELRLSEGSGLKLVRALRDRHPAMRIVVVTDYDSFATVILALQAGADNYLAKPVSESELNDALHDRSVELPPVPDTPLRIERVRWEHIQRILEQCGHNVSDAARRLRMHRRSLQRILSKRAPHPRRALSL